MGRDKGELRTKVFQEPICPHQDVEDPNEHSHDNTRHFLLFDVT